VQSRIELVEVLVLQRLAQSEPLTAVEGLDSANDSRQVAPVS
jgi:hypothetical protein